MLLQVSRFDRFKDPLGAGPPAVILAGTIAQGCQFLRLKPSTGPRAAPSFPSAARFSP